jgi:hypothetical protein
MLLLQRQPRTQTNHPELVFIRIQCRVNQVLDIRRNGELFRQLETVKDL